MHKELREAGKVAAGIRYYLSDTTTGRRSVRWLSEVTGIKRTTLNDKLNNNPGRINSAELGLIAGAFGVDEIDIYRAGEMAVAA